MSEMRYINTQEIRKNLVGFLKSLESGDEVVVLNRSKVIARINHHSKTKTNVGTKQLLKVVESIQSSTASNKNALGRSESYKKRYYDDMKLKYDIS